MERTAPPPSARRPWQRALQLAGAALGALLLLGTFSLYTDPDFMLQMADHVWACF